MAKYRRPTVRNTLKPSEKGKSPCHAGHDPRCDCPTDSIVDLIKQLNQILPGEGLSFRDQAGPDGVWLDGYAPDGEDMVRIDLTNDQRCPACQLAAELRRIAEYFTRLAETADAVLE
jgi:hypothetical protein